MRRPRPSRSVLVNAAQAFGLALVTTGVAAIYWPAALIFAGAAFAAVGVLHDSGEGGS